MSLNPTESPRSGVDGKIWIFRRAARRDQVEHDEGADLLVARRDRLGAQVDDRARREFAGLDTAGEIER